MFFISPGDILYHHIQPEFPQIRRLRESYPYFSVDFVAVEKGAAHFFVLFHFFTERTGGNFKMLRQAVYAHKSAFCSPVYQLFVKGNLVALQRFSATGAFTARHSLTPCR